MSINIGFPHKDPDEGRPSEMTVEWYRGELDRLEQERDRLQTIVRTNEWQASFQSRYEEAEAQVARLTIERVGLKTSTNDCEGLLAGLADCINQELRENGPVDVPQIKEYRGSVDMRHFIRLLVDVVRARWSRLAPSSPRRERE